ncbi:reverse transcriptase domain-containing protein [Tanacetum coccineum]
MDPIHGRIIMEGSGAGFILTSPEGEEFTYALRFEFDASNNEAEYEALIACLRTAEQMGIENLTAKVDSRLVPRSKNKKADALSKIASTSFAHLTKQVLVETLKRKSIEEREILAIVEEEGKSFLEPWLRCVGPMQAEYVVKEIHEESCSMHSGPRSVVAKAIRFGLPREIISDNGKQFRDNPFKDWCEKLNVKQRFVSIKHPQTNDQVKRANRSLGEGIKARLGEDNINWVEEVPHILWAHRTMTSWKKGGKKVAVHKARNKARMEKYYNAKVRSTSFRPGDFVYRSNEASHAKESGKLGPKWEGPYEVIEALGKGAYKLRNGSGDVLPRTSGWGNFHLVLCNYLF